MQCLNNTDDRKKGEYWERCFCELAAENGYVFTPMQIGRVKSASAYSINQNGTWNNWTLPDITVWTYPGQHHEIKHKSPTYTGCFGLEKYRFEALLNFANITKQSVMYTIHNHALNGGTECKDNKIEHWLTTNIMDINKQWSKVQKDGVSWVKGQKTSGVIIYYWKSELWEPLSEYWKGTYTF